MARQFDAQTRIPDQVRCKVSVRATGSIFCVPSDGKTNICSLPVSPQSPQRKLLPSKPPRLWRNWSTRTVQVRVGASPWGFESLQPHRGRTCIRHERWMPR